MDFKKKLKMRLYTALGCIVIGLAMIAADWVWETENELLSAFGFALIGCGIVRIRNYFLITKNEETIRKREIAEKDERNIAISNRAKSAAFSIYLFLVCVAVIAAEFMGKSALASGLAFSVCALLVLYWASYYVIRKRI